MTTAAPERATRSLIPARLDRLRWTPFHTRLVVGYLIGGAMILGGLVELVLGVKAERRPLESVAAPLSAVPAGVSRAGRHLTEKVIA